MNDVRDMALGVIADLRERRLLPVAGALLALVLVLPVVLHKSANTPAATPTPAAQGAPATVNGLPGPAKALSDQQPLVTLTTLNKPSNLQTFKGRDPFKPLTPITSTTSAGSSASSAASTVAASGSPSAAPSTSGGSGASGPTVGGTGGGGSSTPTSPQTGTGTGTGTGTPTKPIVRSYTYVLEGRLKTPNGTRTFHDLDRFSLLPTANHGLIMFVGVTSGGTDALFTFDHSKLQSASGGDAHCRPTKGNCTAVWFQKGDAYKWVDSKGGKYVLTVTKIKKILVSELKKINEAKKKKAKKDSLGAGASGASAAGAGIGLFPMFVDVVTSTR